MRSALIESRVLSLIDSINAGNQIEDSRIELKAAWPDDHARTARQLAGHANAARGDYILWVFGIDEKAGVVKDLSTPDFAEWWAQVISYFEGPTPDPQHISINVEGRLIIALHMTTDRAPFLVKNPRFGKQKGGPVEFEVPWREMTSTRSARRQDLLRILVPKTQAPIVDIIDGHLTGLGKLNRVGANSGYVQELGPSFEWHLDLTLYVVPLKGEAVVFPSHLSTIIAAEKSFGSQELNLYQRRPGGPPELISRDIDLAVDGPSRLGLKARGHFNQRTQPGEIITVEAELPLAGKDIALRFQCDFEKSNTWSYQLAQHRASVGIPRLRKWLEFEERRV